MMIKEYLEKVADLAPSTVEGDEGNMVYVTKFDGSYITRVGMEEYGLLKYLAEHDVSESLRNGTGFSPTEQKWYGWSHRAIFGFSIGSKVKDGDCAYVAKDEADFARDMVNFWEDAARENVTPKITEENGVRGVYVSWRAVVKSNPRIITCGSIGGSFSSFPDTWGRGAWTAETLEDAKQMAVDFNEGVS